MDSIDYGPAREALYRDGDNLARWCGVCSSEMCDDCVAIRDDAARAVVAAVVPAIREAIAQEIEAMPLGGWGFESDAAVARSNAARIVRDGAA